MIEKLLSLNINFHGYLIFFPRKFIKEEKNDNFYAYGFVLPEMACGPLVQIIKE